MSRQARAVGILLRMGCEKRSGSRDPDRCVMISMFASADYASPSIRTSSKSSLMLGSSRP